MKSIIAALLTLSVILPADENILEYGSGQCLRLLEGEAFVETTKAHVAFFDPFHFVGEYQCPIHKVIQGNQYMTYVSIGVGFDSDESALFEAARSLEGAYKVIDTRAELDRSTGLKAYHVFGKHGDLYNHKYFFTIADPLMTLVVNEISKDSMIISGLYTKEDYATARRGCKK